jgi:hypothetical protein
MPKPRDMSELEERRFRKTFPDRRGQIFAWGSEWIILFIVGISAAAGAMVGWLL